MNSCCFVLISLMIFVSSIEAQNLSSTYVPMDYGGSVELNCSGTNPTWYLFNVTTGNTTVITNTGKYKVENRIGVLFIGNLIEDELNHAQYYCNSTDGYQQYFIPNTIPIMAVSNDTKYTHSVTEGGYIEITCQLTVGFNINKSLKWNWTLTRDTDTSTPEIIAVSTGYNLVMSNNDTIGSSHLIIRNVAANMTGIITCTATNNLGSATEKVPLSVRSKFLAALPFFGVMAQVAVACILILFVEKKCAKKNRENEIEFVAETFSSKQNEKEEILSNRNAVTE